MKRPPQLSEGSEKWAGEAADSAGSTIPARRACEHCGTVFRVKEASDRFCCSGCEYVYGLVHDEDLTRFYELGGRDIQPVGSSVFARADWSWIKELQQEAEKGNDVARATLGVSGISCVGCVWLIDKVFDAMEGTVSCRVDAQRGEVNLAWRAGAFDLEDFARKLRKFGYTLGSPSAENRLETHELSWRVGLCAAFGLNAMLYTLPAYLGMEPGFLFAAHFDWLSMLFATASMIAGGMYFIKRAAQALVRGVIHIDLPIAIGLISAYLVSWYGYWIGDRQLFYFDFVSTFAFLMLVGRWVQVYAIERNRRRAQSEDFREPRTRLKTDSGGWREATASELNEGDEYILEVDGIVPVASLLGSRNACFSLDWINGEAEARPFARGGLVPAGAICRGSEAVALKARETWEESLLRKLTARKDDGREIDRVAQRWIVRYLYAVLAVSFAAFAGWFWAAGLDEALGVLVATLVVSCPCGIGIALPLADELVGGGLRKRGIFIRSSTLWNRLTRVTKVVFDKTGTLTRPRLALRNRKVLDSLSDRELQALSSLVSVSTHPVATSLRETLLASKRFHPIEGVASYEEIGYGTTCVCDGHQWRLGRSAWAAPGAVGEGVTLSLDGREVVRFEFGEEAKPDAIEEVEALQRLGLELYSLSGDAQSRVKAIASKAGIPASNVVGDLSPTDKSDWIATAGPDSCLMIGDGANDSLAFDAAGVCGAPASENALLANKADFYFLGEGVGGVRLALEGARSRRRAIRATLAFAIAYNVIAGSFAVAGWVTPLAAAILMPISSLVSLSIVWRLARLRKESVRSGSALGW